MTHLGYERNEYGTLVSSHLCDSCEGFFTVCSPVSKKAKGWDFCLSIDCESYDPDRDVDDVFESMLEAGDIKSREIPED